jgi:uroporphyrinogen-III decarboxylase
MDPVNTLLLGSAADVKADARHRLTLASPGSGYILSSACSVPPAAPPANITMLREAADEFGAGGPA